MRGVYLSTPRARNPPPLPRPRAGGLSPAQPLTPTQPMRNLTPTPDCDLDRHTFERRIDRTRLTPRRFKVLRDYARRFTRNNYRHHCGCPHDCCGCLSSAYADLHYTPTDVVLRVTYCFNY